MLGYAPSWGLFVVIRGQASALRFASAGTAVVRIVGSGERCFGELPGNGCTLAPARGCFGMWPPHAVLVSGRHANHSWRLTEAVSRLPVRPSRLAPLGFVGTPGV